MNEVFEPLKQNQFYRLEVHMSKGGYPSAITRVYHEDGSQNGRGIALMGGTIYIPVDASEVLADRAVSVTVSNLQSVHAQFINKGWVKVAYNPKSRRFELRFYETKHSGAYRVIGQS